MFIFQTPPAAGLPRIEARCMRCHKLNFSARTWPRRFLTTCALRQSRGYIPCRSGACHPKKSQGDHRYSMMLNTYAGTDAEGARLMANVYRRGDNDEYVAITPSNGLVNAIERTKSTRGLSVMGTWRQVACLRARTVTLGFRVPVFTAVTRPISLLSLAGRRTATSLSPSTVLTATPTSPPWDTNTGSVPEKCPPRVQRVGKSKVFKSDV